MRKVSVSEKAFICGLGLILLFMLLHDWVPLGTLNNVQAVKMEHSISELMKITAIQTLSILVVIAIALTYVGKKYPLWAKLWLVIHLGSILTGAILAWWIPYFFGTSPERVDSYSLMFGDTHSFLPIMNGIVPNTIHVFFHLTLLITWILAIYISLKKVRVEKQHPIEFN